MNMKHLLSHRGLRRFALMAMALLMSFSYAKAQYTVTVYLNDNEWNDVAWGTVTGNEGTYANGTTVTLTVTPISGKEVREWYNSDGDIIAINTNTCDIVVNGNTEVWVVMGNATMRYYLTANVRPAEYSAFCSVTGAGEKLENATPTLTAHYESPYTIDHWEIGGVTVAGNADNYTLSPMSSDVTVDAYFAYMPQDRTISVVSNDPTHGSVSMEDGAGVTGTTLTITERQPLTLIATELDPTNYTFTGWFLGDDLLSTDATYTFNLPDNSGNNTYTAHFENANNTYTMTAVANPAAGAASLSPNPTSNPRVNTSFTFSTTAAAGYDCLGWYDENDHQLTTELSYTVNPVLRDRTLTAKFRHEPWTVTANVNPTGAGTVSPASTTVEDGGSITLTATANPGFFFTGWSGTGLSGSTNPYTINNVRRNYTDIVANFVATHTITLTNATLSYTNTTAHAGRYEHGTFYRVTPNDRSGYASMLT